MLKEQNYQCWLCQKLFVRNTETGRLVVDGITFDHIIPMFYAKGIPGANVSQNGYLACKKCNSARNHRLIEEMFKTEEECIEFLRKVSIAQKRIAKSVRILGDNIIRYMQENKAYEFYLYKAVIDRVPMYEEIEAIFSDLGSL
jgi:hypothetical protein